jgi:hypothetical protein
MEPEGSLPHSQAPTTCPYPEPEHSNPCSPPHFLKSSSALFTKYHHDDKVSGHVASTGKRERNANRILVRKSEGDSPFG